jgi:hypothetical protein
MNITLKRTPEQVELVKAMASRNRNVAYEAQVALAEFIGPVLAEVLNNALKAAWTLLVKLLLALHKNFFLSRSALPLLCL